MKTAAVNNPKPNPKPNLPSLVKLRAVLRLRTERAHLESRIASLDKLLKIICEKE